MTTAGCNEAIRSAADCARAPAIAEDADATAAAAIQSRHRRVAWTSNRCTRSESLRSVPLLLPSNTQKRIARIARDDNSRRPCTGGTGGLVPHHRPAASSRRDDAVGYIRSAAARRARLGLISSGRRATGLPARSTTTMPRASSPRPTGNSSAPLAASGQKTRGSQPEYGARTFYSLARARVGNGRSPGNQA